MGKEPRSEGDVSRLGTSNFEKLVRQKRPQGARYYVLTGYNRQHQEVRIPTRGAFRVVDPFQHPSANPGTYFVRYCRDSAGHEPISGKRGFFFTTLAAEDTAQEQSGHSSTEFAAFEDAVLRSAPPTATHYYLKRLGGRAERVPEESTLQLRDPFQFPQDAKVGMWELNYCQGQGKPLSDVFQVSTWVEVKEPVGHRDEGAGTLADEEQEAASLWAILENQEELKGLLAESRTLIEEYTQRIDALTRQEPAQPDYTPVLTTLISAIRDLWIHSQPPPAATKSPQAAEAAQRPPAAPSAMGAREAPAALVTLVTLHERLAAVETQLAEIARQKHTTPRSEADPLGGAAAAAARR